MNIPELVVCELRGAPPVRPCVSRTPNCGLTMPMATSVFDLLCISMLISSDEGVYFVRTLLYSHIIPLGSLVRWFVFNRSSWRLPRFQSLSLVFRQKAKTWWSMMPRVLSKKACIVYTMASGARRQRGRTTPQTECRGQASMLCRGGELPDQVKERVAEPLFLGEGISLYLNFAKEGLCVH